MTIDDLGEPLLLEEDGSMMWVILEDALIGPYAPVFQSYIMAARKTPGRELEFQVCRHIKGSYVPVKSFNTFDEAKKTYLRIYNSVLDKIEPENKKWLSKISK